MGKLASTSLNQVYSLSFCPKRYTSHLNTLMPVREWDGISVTFDLGTKSVYSSLCELLEHFQEELRKLPEICKDVYWSKANEHLGDYVTVFQGGQGIEGMSLPSSGLLK